MEYNSVIKIKETDKTPLLEYNPKNGVFNVVGVSVPDNASEFYSPVILWLEEYIKSPNELITINVKLDYFSIQSAKYLLAIFKIFEGAKIYSDVTINWYYDDPDIKETGSEFSEMVNIKFNLVDE